MAAPRGLFRRGHTEETGFTIIEAVVAAAILVIAIVLTITPLIVAMRSLDRSKDVTIAEGLAQAQIEEIRALEFGDVGHPGGAPEGIVLPVEVVTIEGADYNVATAIEFVGSASGLNIIPQGGDGVEGAFDIGVNYKYVKVVVAPVTGGGRPVTMETFIAPPTIGGLENIAVVEVQLDRHEPFGPSTDTGPAVRLSGPWIYDSFDTSDAQFFADIRPGDYAISLVTSRGWLLHPESVASGATDVTAAVGVNAQRAIRVYQPVSLDVSVVDDVTGLPIGDAVVTAANQIYGPPITNAAGDYNFDDLVPDPYRVEATAPGYQLAWVEVDVASGGETAEIRMIAHSFTAVDYTFAVDYAGSGSDHVHGADVTVTHPVYGAFVGSTDAAGRVTLGLPESTSDFTVTASTSFGHGPDSATFATGTGPASINLSLNKPPSTDVFSLREGALGPAGFFDYRVGGGSWNVLPANDLGSATFIVPESPGTLVELRSFCSAGDYPATPAATTATALDGSDRSWRAGVSC
jgi:hypothetical protein